jgi:negative regulator of flagellin synthesis FlgM
MVRINGVGRPTSMGVAKKSEKRSKSSGGGKAGSQVKVADAAGLREKAKVMLADMPETRLERVEEIRGALERGEYHVDGEHVAERIIANALAERSW